MFVRRIALASALLAASLLLPTTNTWADGVVRLDWSTCSGLSPVDQAVLPGWSVRLTATVIGQSAGHQAYELWFQVAPQAGAPAPDAWRFDPGGCQGSDLISFDYMIAAAIKTCPSFPGGLQAVQIKDFAFDAMTGRSRIVFANAYPPGLAAPIPQVRYLLLSVGFDHWFSTTGPTVPGVSCGGLETPLCFVLTKANWLTLDGVETPWAVDRGYLTANDPQGASACPGVTPARPATWGGLKSQYRQ